MGYWGLFKMNLTEDKLGLWPSVRNTLFWLYADNLKWYPQGATGCVCGWWTAPGFMRTKQREAMAHIEVCPQAIAYRESHAQS